MLALHQLVRSVEEKTLINHVKTKMRSADDKSPTARPRTSSKSASSWVVQRVGLKNAMRLFSRRRKSSVLLIETRFIDAKKKKERSASASVNESESESVQSKPPLNRAKRSACHQ